MKNILKKLLFFLCGLTGIYFICVIISAILIANMITLGWIIQNVFFALIAFLSLNIAFRHEKIYENIKNHIFSKLFWGAAGAGMAVFAVFSVLVGIKMYEAVNTKTPQGLPVISLGGGFIEDKPDENQAERLDVTYDYLVDNPEVMCIVSNGAPAPDGRVYGELMRDYLVNKGIDGDRIIVEGKSTDTDENMIYSKELLEEYKLGDKAVIVTSSTHMYRSLLRAQESGINAKGLSAPNQNMLFFPVAFLHEVLGVAEYLLLG